MKKTQDFIKLIEASFPSEKHDNIKQQLVNCRHIMLRHTVFVKLSVIEQFELCQTICLIAIQTTRDDLLKLKNLGFNENEKLEYSIYKNCDNNKTIVK